MNLQQVKDPGWRTAARHKLLDGQMLGLTQFKPGKIAIGSRYKPPVISTEEPLNPPEVTQYSKAQRKSLGYLEDVRAPNIVNDSLVSHAAMFAAGLIVGLSLFLFVRG